MADDGKPPRIRWHDEPGLFAGFSGYVGTSEAALFRIYAPQTPGADHALVPNFIGMGKGPAYGTPDEVKAEAERWLTEFAASLGAVFPDITLWGVRYDGPGGVVQRYSDEADARQAKREIESLKPADKPTVMSRQTWAGEWKEEADGGC